jgi:hypothetical protein
MTTFPESLVITGAHAIHEEWAHTPPAKLESATLAHAVVVATLRELAELPSDVVSAVTLTLWADELDTTTTSPQVVKEG